MDIFSQQIFDFAARNQVRLKRLRKQQEIIRECRCPGAFQLINLYVKEGMELADKAGFHHLDALQESYLLMVYQTLLETSLDVLLPHCWRIGCLDQLYKPMFELRRFYADQPNGERRICALFQDLKINADYSFNAPS